MLSVKHIIKEQSFEFALESIELHKKLTQKNEFIISKQLLRSATSVWVNIEEASAGQTKKDFHTKMSIASKEARETRYWLRLLDRGLLVDVSLKKYLDEIEEIIKILTKIVKTTGENIKISSKF